MKENYVEVPLLQQREIEMRVLDLSKSFCS